MLYVCFKKMEEIFTLDTVENHLNYSPSSTYTSFYIYIFKLRGSIQNHDDRQLKFD